MKCTGDREMFIRITRNYILSTIKHYQENNVSSALRQHTMGRKQNTFSPPLLL